MAEFKIEGLDDVLRKLREIEPKIAKKGLVRAVRKGANIVRDDARRRAREFDDPSTKESITKNIVTQVNNRLGKRVGGVALRVGVRGGARLSKDNVGYWRLLEFGTSKMPAQPFMRPALESNAEKAADAIAVELNRQLDEVL